MHDAPDRSLQVINNVSSLTSSINPQIKRNLQTSYVFFSFLLLYSSSGVLCASCSISSTILHGTRDNARQRVTGEKEHENNNCGRVRCEAFTSFERECEESDVLLLKSSKHPQYKSFSISSFVVCSQFGSRFTNVFHCSVNFVGLVLGIRCFRVFLLELYFSLMITLMQQLCLKPPLLSWCVFYCGFSNVSTL